jgi:hypothetical protein
MDFSKEEVDIIDFGNDRDAPRPGNYDSLSIKDLE